VERALSKQPLILHSIAKLAPEGLQREVWDATQGKGWYFGNQSLTEQAAIPFWKMDLDQSAPVTRLWEHAQAQCEEKTGRKLRVARQYANGHTFGQGGRPHVDDTREGTFTLLYYPMPEWRVEWEGETVFTNGRDTIGVIAPQPNRAVLFDSRIPHYGRAPSRACTGLRVTVAYKLEPA